MPTTRPKTHSVEEKTAILSDLVRQSDDLHADEVLAFLAYSVHGQTQPLIEAREAGAELGSVGNSAYMLRNRIEEELA